MDFDGDIKQYKIELFWSLNSLIREWRIMHLTSHFLQPRDGRRALRAEEGRPAHTQKGHTLKRPWHSLIF